MIQQHKVVRAIGFFEGLTLSKLVNQSFVGCFETAITAPQHQKRNEQERYLFDVFHRML
jgi:hypothetical protein